MAKHNRNAQLDFLRATAIVAVVLFHVLQMSPEPLPKVMSTAKIGKYGVDLFFVLSGWLIGGLYWREEVASGRVKIWNFWLRRWLRTIPPYLVALILAWIAVYLQRKEVFDWRYLIFAQNYFEKIPFFLVSWSLCVEEHFYLFLPALILLFPCKFRTQTVLFVCLIAVSPICRWWLSTGRVSSDFGHDQTATHLRMEGLILGFWLARLRLEPKTWTKIQRFSGGALGVCTLALFLVSLAGPILMYRIGLTLLAAGLASALVFRVDRKPSKLVKSQIVYKIALASYSIYLTHALMIHAARSLVDRLPNYLWPAYFPIVITLIAGAGWGFYFFIERTSIQLRDITSPRPSSSSNVTV